MIKNQNINSTDMSTLLSTPANTDEQSEQKGYRITPILDVPDQMQPIQWLASIHEKQWKEKESGYQENAIINSVDWDSLRDTIVWSKKEVETGVTAVMAVSKKSHGYHEEFWPDRMIIVNNKVILKNKSLKYADINQDGKMVYILGNSVFTKDIYDENHHILAIAPIVKKWETEEEWKKKIEDEKRQLEQAPKYPNLIQGPFITSSGQVIIIGTKLGDQGTHLYIDHQKIPLDIHEVSAPLKIENNAIFVSFKTPGWIEQTVKIELDNPRERPKKGDYLVQWYRALTQRQVSKIMVLTEQRDNLVKLHDDKITKITDKDAEIARLLKLLEQEKEKTDILSERIDILENTLARQKEWYMQDISEMKLAHGGVVTVIHESLENLWAAINKPWAFWGNLKEQAIIASERIRKATAQIRHA